eukprot:734952-Rhodomonas_salina.1
MVPGIETSVPGTTVCQVPQQRDIKCSQTHSGSKLVASYARGQYCAVVGPYTAVVVAYGLSVPWTVPDSAEHVGAYSRSIPVVAAGVACSSIAQARTALRIAPHVVAQYHTAHTTPWRRPVLATRVARHAQSVRRRRVA